MSDKKVQHKEVEVIDINIEDIFPEAAGMNFEIVDDEKEKNKKQNDEK